MSPPKLVPLIAERLALLDGNPPTDLGQRSAHEDAQMRAFFAPLPGYVAPRVAVNEFSTPGPHGPIRLREYRPLGGAVPSRGLVWAHGGAFIGGDVDMPEADVVARELVGRTGSVVVSVDYRLCRDGVRFPFPHDDLHAAYLSACSSELASTDATWAIGGASAGANLAAGVAQRLRDEGRPAGALVLAYPHLHAHPPHAPSDLAALVAQLPTFLRSDPASCEILNANFLGASPEDTPYAFPGDGEVAGLPPTLVVLCECDGLLPSGALFVEQLGMAKVRVEVEVVPGMVHGHLNIPGLSAAATTIDRIGRFLTP